MIKLDKKTLDEFIKITNKYISSGDTDFLEKEYVIQKKLLDNVKSPKDNIRHVIYELCVMKTPYSKIYEVLNVLGFEVVDDVD